MKTSDFDYELPPELIAQSPVEPRDASRLLVVDRRTGEIAHRRFRDVVEYLRPGDLLMGNDSRVIPARLKARKSTGGVVEILLLRPAPTALPVAPFRTFGVEDAADAWECLVGGKGLRPGVRLAVQFEATGRPRRALEAVVLDETPAGGRMIAFDVPVAEWLWEAGQVPLPPYIHQPLANPERYQTVYSRVDGSVASSTAGLHFTPDLLLQVRERGVSLAFVTLHIGLDTFRPVQVEEIEEHPIHREWAELTPQAARAINETRLAGGRIVAVGTTVVRTLETAALSLRSGAGALARGSSSGDASTVGHFVGGDSSRSCSCLAAAARQTVSAFTGDTDLFIRPGHRFLAVDALVTNFHLPRSTLLMLVSAFAGKELIDLAYAEAVRERYRFYSFGDAMLIQ